MKDLDDISLTISEVVSTGLVWTKDLIGVTHTLFTSLMEGISGAKEAANRHKKMKRYKRMCRKLRDIRGCADR